MVTFRVAPPAQRLRPWVAVMLASATLLAACHNATRIEDTRPGAVSFVVDQSTAHGGQPRIAITEQSRWRFEIPLLCDGQEFVEQNNSAKVRYRPNVATFVVGVVVGTLGAIATASSWTSDGRSNNPLSYAGPIGIATGGVLMIGPWIGNGEVEIPGSTEKRPRFKRQGECGSRPIAARTALLEFRGVRVFGTVSDDGEFSVSPYQFVDAFDAGKIPAFDITATLATATGIQQVTTVIDASVLASRKQAFLRTADFDAHIEPFRLVPNFDRPLLRTSLTTVSGAPALRVVVAATNTGPGDAWALRAHIVANVPDVDGRLIYLGHVAKGATVQRELLIPLDQAGAERLRGGELSLSLDFADAYGTAPSVPTRFVGAVLNDAPR